MSELTLEALNADLAVMAKRKRNTLPAKDTDVPPSGDRAEWNREQFRKRRQNPRPISDKARKRRVPLPAKED